MPNLKSSKKSVRKIAKLTAKNKAEKTRLKTYTKYLKEAQEAKNSDQIKTLAIKVMSLTDKARKHGVLHRNKANRVKSRLSTLIFKAK